MSAPSDKPTPMDLDAARARLLQDIQAVEEVESVSTFSALGRVLAADVVSSVDVPPTDNSAMDGFAVRCADVSEPGARLLVAQRIAAGHVGRELAVGSAARIFTGAPIPPGADAVVMQEHCSAEAQSGSVQINRVPRSGDNIRRRGEDVTQGASVLLRGTRISPQAMGLIASVGRPAVDVFRRVRVALLSSGDELVMPGTPLPPGAIYNSNRYVMRGLIEALGASCTDMGIVVDRLDATRDALRTASAEHDVVLTTGGVSVGEEDHLKAAVQAEGELSAWQLAIKPGKPLAFGRIQRAGLGASGSLTWFVGLPGNPVAAFVTFLTVVRPLLIRLSGRSEGDAAVWPLASLRAEFDWTHPDPRRREFLRARRTGDGGVQVYAQQGSAVLTSAVWADGLVDLAPGQVVRRGDPVAFVPFAELWA